MAKKVAGYIKLQVPAGRGQSVAAHRPGAGSARPQHHGVLQGVQRQDPGPGKEHADPGDHHRVLGQELHLRDEDRARVLLPEEGGQAVQSGSKSPGIASAGSVTRAQVRAIAEAKMKDLNANDIENAMLHDRRLGPLDGHHGEGLRPWQSPSVSRKPPKAWTAAKSYTVEEAVKLVKARATAKFDETIELSLNLGVDPKHADQMVRGVVSLPSGTGRSLARRGVRQGRQGGRGQEGRRRPGGRRRSGRTGEQGRDRFRPLHRHARHDGHRRPPGQSAGPAQPDAQSQGRHGDHGRRPRRSRTPRAARWNSASRRRASCRPASARPASPKTPSSPM